ncbi:class C beta-lactamase-related serine hydrolase [Candidatus Thorarchaeota archaeon]|nr:MAG: class C beta-lactamase-related serine hydrolase [Candidatus Thorarchaeota archaeon]
MRACYEKQGPAVTLTTYLDKQQGHLRMLNIAKCERFLSVTLATHTPYCWLRMSFISGFSALRESLQMLGSRWLVLVLAALLVLGSPTPDTFWQGASANAQSSHPFEIPEWLRDYYPTEEWRFCTPEEQGMNSTRLNEMLPYIAESGWLMDSIIVIRGGYVVFEAYPGDLYTEDYYHTLQSVTKSFVSCLIGLAIREGILPGVDSTILDLFSERSPLNVDDRKERMTVEHLLTMTSGVEWDESTYPFNDTERNSLTRMVLSEDCIDHFLSLPMVSEPGEQWVYSSGATIVLAALIEELSDYDLMDFAHEFLFDPIGIEGAVCIKTHDGYYHGGGGLYLKPRDMARFGYLYLNGGNWDGQQVVPLDWVLSSTRYQVYLPPSLGYGYLWWLHPGLDAYQAHGRFGQRIAVSPEEDLVVVYTASLPDYIYNPEDELLRDFILDSITGPPRTVNESTQTSSTSETQGSPLLVPLGLSVSAVVFVAVWLASTKRRPISRRVG